MAALTVEHSELHGWPREKWLQTGFFAERKLVCAWANRDALVAELGASGGHVYPYGTLGQGSSDSFSARAIAVTDVRPLGGAVTALNGNTELADYAKAVITVIYITPSLDWVVLDGENSVLMTEELAPAGEFITLDNTEYFRLEGAEIVRLKPGEAPGKRVSQMSYTITYFNVVPGTAWTQFLLDVVDTDVVNHCNVAAWTTSTLAFTFVAQTVQYMWTKLSRTFQTGEFPTWTIQQRFLFFAHGWNNVWNPSADNFEPLYEDDGATEKILVPTVDFDKFKLFLGAAPE